MKVPIASEFRDLPGGALKIALEALGHEVVSDPAAAKALLAKTAKGRAFLRFGGLLRTVLDRVKGIGAGLDEPMTDSDADVGAMLDIVELFVPPKKPLGLGFHLVRAAEVFRRRDQYELALRTLEVALTCGDDIRAWARGEATLAMSSALWLLHPDNTGIPLDVKRCQWFLERCLPGGASDVLVHLEAARLYAAMKDEKAACAQLARFLERGAFFVAEIESDPRLKGIRTKPAYVAAIKKARSALPDDPDRCLDALLGNREACAELHPTPVPRAKVTKTAPTIAALYGRDLPTPLTAWLGCLDQWDIGYSEIYDWKAWNPESSRRSWNPLAIPKESDNAFAWLFTLDGLATKDWKTRAATATLELVFAGAVPVGRTHWDTGELGVHVDPDGKHDEVVLFDREKNELAVVASGLDAFIAYQARASARGKKPPRDALPSPLGARVRFGAKLSRGVYAVHGEGTYKARSKVTDFVRRSTWIVDLLTGIPKLPVIARDYTTHAADDRELDALWNQPKLDSVAEGLYWLWHLYFVGEDELLAKLLERAARSPAKYVRDAATLIARALERPTKLGRVDLGKQREAFLAKIGKKASTKKPAAKTAATFAEQACDAKALMAAIKPLQAVFKAFPSGEGKITEAGLDTRVAAMPDTIGDYFAAVERPEMPASGARNFAMTLLVSAAFASAKKTTKHAKTLRLNKGEVTVYYGDLDVRGDLHFDGLLIVLGDLVVDGVLRDCDDFAHLWVSGSLRAKAVYCSFTAWVGKTLEANAVVLGRRGNIFTARGIDTPLAIRDDYEGEGFRGAVRTKHFIDVEKDDGALSRVIAEKFLEEDDGHVTLDADALVTAVARGKRVLR